MPIFVGSAQVQKMYIGSAEVTSVVNSGTNVLGVPGSFPGVADSNLYLPLKTSIVPSRGSSTPTFTRATAAWSFDNEGKLNLNIPSGCARFTGARFVRNRVATTSATLAVAATNTVTLARAETVTFSMGAGTGTATFSGTAGATGTLTASPSGRTQITKTCAAGTFIITASVADLVDIQVEVVSGQADQTASEYVSVGVLSSPYHGAGTASTADGCKWFPTNKDGSAIPAANLRRYLAEPSRANNCLWSTDLTNAVWTAVNVTPTKTATGIDNVANSASRITVEANNGTIKQLLTAATGSRTLSVYVKRISGTGTLELTRNDGTNWTDRTSQLVANTWVRVSLTADTGANSTIGYRFGTAGDVFEFDISQDENGAWPTSPIITTTAAVTRNADVLNYTSAGFINDTAGTVIASVAVASGQTATTYAISTNNTFGMLYKGNSGTNLSSQDGTLQINTGTWSNDGLSKKIGVTWSGSARGVCFNGGAVTAGAYDGSWNATSIQVGTLGANYLGGYIGDVHVWTTALIDAQLQQVLS